MVLEVVGERVTHTGESNTARANYVQQRSFETRVLRFDHSKTKIVKRIRQYQRSTFQRFKNYQARAKDIHREYTVRDYNIFNSGYGGKEKHVEQKKKVMRMLTKDTATAQTTKSDNKASNEAEKTAEQKPEAYQTSTEDTRLLERSVATPNKLPVVPGPATGGQKAKVDVVVATRTGSRNEQRLSARPKDSLQRSHTIASTSVDAYTAAAGIPPQTAPARQPKAGLSPAVPPRTAPGKVGGNIARGDSIINAKHLWAQLNAVDDKAMPAKTPRCRTVRKYFLPSLEGADQNIQNQFIRLMARNRLSQRYPKYNSDDWDLPRSVRQKRMEEIRVFEEIRSKAVKFFDAPDLAKRWAKHDLKPWDRLRYMMRSTGKTTLLEQLKALQEIAEAKRREEEKEALAKAKAARRPSTAKETRRLH